MSEPTAEIDKFCAACGYNLRAIASDRCPECGTPHDPNQSMAPQIPWSHRKTLGRRRAFWRTVKLATFRTKTFAGEINRPISLADAQRFRRMVVLHAWLVIALPAAFGYLQGLDLFDRPWQPLDKIGSIHQWLGLPVMLFSIWAFLMLATGMLSFFYHPRRLPVRLQNRAVALSYYACAPWAYLFIVPVIVALFMAGVYAGLDPDQHGSTLGFALMCVVLASPIVILIAAIWFTPQAMIHRTTQCDRGWLMLIGFIFHPLFFVTSAILTLGLINGAYWAFGMMLVSLR